MHRSKPIDRFFRSPKKLFQTTYQQQQQLLDTNAIGVRREKMYQLDGHIGCAVAGITGEMMERRERGESS